MTTTRRLLTIDAEVCFGGGTCALAEPQFFKAHPGHASEVRRELDETLSDARSTALIDACPSGALAMRHRTDRP